MSLKKSIGYGYDSFSYKFVLFYERRYLFFYAVISISSGTTPCQVFNSLNTCPSGQECAEDNGVVQCRLSFFSCFSVIHPHTIVNSCLLRYSSIHYFFFSFIAENFKAMVRIQGCNIFRYERSKFNFSPFCPV